MGLGSIGGIVSGLVGSSQKLPTVDIRGLMDTINKSGDYQKTLINQLPEHIKQQLAEYAASNADAAGAYKGNIEAQGKDYMASVAGLYGPNSPAALEEKAANKADIYSTVPGTEDAVRNAMAASGGLARGNAGVALADPYLKAAGDYSRSAMHTNAAQTAAGQSATQQALQVVNSMDEAMFTNLFGMSKQQAQTILTTGNQALANQLSQLITQNNNQTGQSLAVQGIAVNNGYQNAVTRNAQQNAIYSGLANTALQGLGVEDASGGMSMGGGNMSAILQGLGVTGGGGAASMGAPGAMGAAGSTLLPAALAL